MNQVYLSTTVNPLRQLFIYVGDDCLTLADSNFWIPFSCTSSKTELEVDNLEIPPPDLATIEFNAIPTVQTVKLTFLKILLKTDTVESMKFLGSLWLGMSEPERKNNLLRTVELTYFLKTVLQNVNDREEICRSVFAQSYYQTISKIDLIGELIMHERATSPTCYAEVPKWKGKSMQFIELISIGIELNLFEGSSQNQICNSLLKAFQVEAESDQPIYKQRFNALFKRSKIQLPLIADYITRVQDAKKMKVIFTRE